MKSKSNSLPKSAFSNIQLRVQEIRDQLEVLKASSHSSGSKALQQVLLRIRPPTLHSEYLDEGFEEAVSKANAKFCTPVHPNNPIYSLAASSEANNSELGTERKLRPGFLNNRKFILVSAIKLLLLSTINPVISYQKISNPFLSFTTDTVCYQYDPPGLSPCPPLRWPTLLTTLLTPCPPGLSHPTRS